MKLSNFSSYQQKSVKDEIQLMHQQVVKMPCFLLYIIYLFSRSSIFSVWYSHIPSYLSSAVFALSHNCVDITVMANNSLSLVGAASSDCRTKTFMDPKFTVRFYATLFLANELDYNWIFLNKPVKRNHIMIQIRNVSNK